MTECINLREEFGDRFRISFDPVYDPKGRPRDKLDPWMMQIPCRRGVIYPYGGNLLAVEIDGHSVTRKRLRRLDGIAVHQDGDDGTTFLFDVEQFEQVAELVLPKRRRQLTEAQREQARQRMIKLRQGVPIKRPEIEPQTHAKAVS